MPPSKNELQNVNIPSALQEIIEDFQFCEGREKIELLIQYAESLPDLPEWLKENREEMDQVHECMTPVFVQPELSDNGLVFHFEVPAESPTVRGFASLMKQGLDHASPEEVLAVPNDFFTAMGLEKVLSYQRLNGLSAILAHMKRLSLKEMPH
jgi:cysteine desulfuration protein SufE